MTAKNTPTPKDALQSEEFELENAIGHNPLAFTGVMLASSTSRAINPRTKKISSRWTEMALYQVTQGDNTGLYVLEVVGMSDVYHLVGVDCSKNRTSITSDKLRAERPEAVPCWDCNPPSLDEVLPPMLVVEEDRPQLSTHTTPQSIKDKLTERTFGTLSNPAQQLLTEASEHDPVIHAFLHQVVRL